jgi:lipoprotein-releasing system ATP-binding protein
VGSLPALSVEALHRNYLSGSNRLTVLDRVSFEVARGERVAIVGESGAGKSTLLYLLGGLDRPDGGTVRYGGDDIFSLDDAALASFRNRRIGFVWQQNSLLPEFTAAENVAMPLRIAGVEPGRAEAMARERLEEVGLGARSHHRPGELSGGEQQRAALARALVFEPEVLLADEPTGNLDPRTAAVIVSLIEDIQKTRGLTSIMVTHNFEFAKRCDRVLKLEGGAVVNGSALPQAP